MKSPGWINTKAKLYPDFKLQAYIGLHQVNLETE